MLPCDGLHAIEETFVLMLHIPPSELDNTRIDTIFQLLGYLARKDEKNDALKIGGKNYKKVSADDVGWL